jgi:O-acetyl-ADP-ribose deacetylase (regulator of RNase III)
MPTRMSCWPPATAGLDVAGQLNVRSIAFPAISTGIYGFPRGRAATIAVSEALSYSGGIERLIFVCFDAARTFCGQRRL